MFALSLVTMLEESIKQAIGPEAVVYCIAAIGLNIHFGYTGLLNFGQVGFMLMGAYGLAMPIVLWELPAGLAIFVGLLYAAGFALILGAPTLRLRADYLAIVTIAAAEIAKLLARSRSMRSWTRGAEGLNEWNDAFLAVNPWDKTTYTYEFLGFSVTYTGLQVFTMVFGWILVALLTLFVWLLMRSPWGRVLKAIREDEDAVRALGKNAYSYKMQALILGGVIGGMAGMVQVIGKGTVQPETFGPQITFLIWTVMILGGAGRVASPIFGAIFFWFLITFAEQVLFWLIEPGHPLANSQFLKDTDISGWRFIFVGLGLMGLMIFRPQGVFGDREEMALDAR